MPHSTPPSHRKITSAIRPHIGMRIPPQSSCRLLHWRPFSRKTMRCKADKTATSLGASPPSLQAFRSHVSVRADATSTRLWGVALLGVYTGCALAIFLPIRTFLRKRKEILTSENENRGNLTFQLYWIRGLGIKRNLAGEPGIWRRCHVEAPRADVKKAPRTSSEGP